MRYLKDAIDGSKAIIGSFAVHKVFVSVMLIAMRLPVYEDKERTDEALRTKIFLILYHLAMGAIRYWNIYRSNFNRASITIWMMLTVFTIIYLCQRWIFYFDLELETKEQREWYVWCSIEFYYFCSTIIAAVIIT